MTDFDTLWNYDDPAATEEAFRNVLAKEREEMSEPRRAELLSQIGRTLGLQRRFDEAHEVLDEATVFAGGDPTALARCFLERGRLYNSSGQKERAIPFFERALEKAREPAPQSEVERGQRHPDFYAVDALHMLAIASPPDEQTKWHEKAIEAAEASPHALTRNWLGSLYNNLGWTLHDAGKYEEALGIFDKALAFRKEQGEPKLIRIGEWTLARCLRSLGRHEEALHALKRIHSGGEEEDGYVEEELGENLVALDRQQEAQPHFAKAYALLADDPWLKEFEPQRLARLWDLGGLERAQ